ncbi:RecT-like protein [Burkholderia phage BcepIL02]|uniref:RecT-like protein n=1 Tax=Burkholderia phage BcepIL02 TaxID=2886898 RepID=C5IHJ8_9CAUD|nr:RecT-like ssDNA annealing protein [Burkholderia phage BcepIL02]ACR14999.1 RecT-like protein [Burkholderia phage BcepIL02]
MSEQMSNEQQPAEQKPTPYIEFREKLNRGIRVEIEKALPPDIDVDRFIRTVLTSVQMNPDLLYANRQSLMNACMRAAQDGLFPDGREAVLNIYNTKVKVRDGNNRLIEEWVPMVQYLPMVRGILKVMRNSGEVANIDAAAVYAKDHFRFVRGDDPRIEHEPYLGDDDPGPVVAAYMIVKLSNGEVRREVMPRRDIEKTRLASKNAEGANSPWTKWYDQMAIKGVIKRGAKLLPASSDRLDRVIDHDNEASGFDAFNQRGVDASAITQEAATAPAAPAAPATPATPAVTDQRAEQDQRRPSRMQSIVSKSRTAEPVAATRPAAGARAAAAGLPTEQMPLEAAE